MKRIAISLMLLPMMLAATTTVRAQIITAGSTAPGDYLRGIGIAAWGEGLYNLNTAQGYSVTVDANIRGDQYLSAVFQWQRENYHKLLQQRLDKEKRNYLAIEERTRDRPEDIDVFRGAALNKAFEQMNDPSIQDSTRRGGKVDIPPEMIRRIPFKLDQMNLTFSLQRLTARGKGKWPVAFQQDNYALDLKEYEQAIDTALDQMIDGKISNETIDRYKGVVLALTNKLEREYEGRAGDRRYLEAKTRLREMAGAVELMKAQKAQSIMADIDRYKGRTVNDLREFMNVHHLKFAEVDDKSKEERALYVQLYESINEMRKQVVATPVGR